MGIIKTVKQPAIDRFINEVKYLKRVFGLDNWEMIVVYSPDLKQNARTMADPRYYVATISVSKELLENEEKWEMVIVHELIHVVMALYDFYADNLGKEGSNELFYIARENSVSQLAHIIMRIIKKQVPPITTEEIWAQYASLKEKL